MNNNKLLDPKSDHGQRYILAGLIDKRLHKMKSELTGKPHLFDAMVDFVKFPHPGYPMEHSVYVPLNEICNYKHNQELCPCW